MGVSEQVLTNPASALTKPVQAEQNNIELPDNGGSVLDPQNFKNTVPYLYRVNFTCLETLSEADFLCLKNRTSVAIEKTNNDISQETVFDALARSENKEFRIRRASTQVELKELLTDLERIKSDHRMWIVYNVKNSSSSNLAIRAENECLQLQTGQEAMVDLPEKQRQPVPQVFEQAFIGEEGKLDPDAVVLMKAEELRMILGVEIGQSLMESVIGNDGVIEIKGVILREPLEVTKLEQPSSPPKPVSELPKAESLSSNYILGGSFSYEDLSKN